MVISKRETRRRSLTYYDILMIYSVKGRPAMYIDISRLDIFLMVYFNIIPQLGFIFYLTSTTICLLISNTPLQIMEILNKCK